MPTYQGVLLASPAFFEVPQAVQNPTRANPANVRFLLDSFEQRSVSSAHVRFGPVDIISPQTFSGQRAFSLLDDFYERVHFIPDQFDFGGFTVDTVRTVKVWNSFTVTTTSVLSMDLPSGYGVSDPSPYTLPLVLKPIELFTVNLLATGVGVTSFDFDFLFTFSKGPGYEASVKGERKIIPEWGPNWRDSMTESLAFSTEILNVSRSGKEQRRALREEPRISMSYTMSLFGRTRQLVEGTLNRWRRAPMQNPIGLYRPLLSIMDPYRMVVTAEVPALETAVPVKNVPRWVLPGMVLHLRHREMTVKRTAIVGAVGVNSIELANGVPLNMPVGTELVRVDKAQLQETIGTTRITDDVQETSIVVNVLPGENPKYTPSGPVTPLLNGYEIFSHQPNWASEVDVSWEMPLQIVDFSRGVIESQELTHFPKTVTKFLFTGRTHEDILIIKDFWLRQKGQLGEFLMPTWSKDMVPKQDLAFGDDRLRVHKQELLEDYGNETTHKYLCVMQYDGTKTFKRIKSFAPVKDVIGDDTILNIAGTWDANIPVTSIQRVCFVMRSRFATDSLTIEWITDGIANIELTFRSLEAL